MHKLVSQMGAITSISDIDIIPSPYDVIPFGNDFNWCPICGIWVDQYGHYCARNMASFDCLSIGV